MATFPLLSTGAVTQFPAVMESLQAARVIRFMDGSDQRYLFRGRILRRWQIQVNLLSESEIAQLEAFFVEQQGQYSAFDFPDPFTGDLVPNCCFGADSLSTIYSGVDLGSTSFWVVERDV